MKTTMTVHVTRPDNMDEDAWEEFLTDLHNALDDHSVVSEVRTFEAEGE